MLTRSYAYTCTLAHRYAYVYPHTRAYVARNAESKIQG